MKGSSCLGRALVLFATLWGTAGCPVLLSDDFDKVAGHSGPAGAGASTDHDAAAFDASTGGAPPVADGSRSPEDGAMDASPCTLCTPQQACCDGRCVDLHDDPSNCRTCGNGCPGTLCSNATCTNICAIGFVDCNHNVVDGCEVNAATDPANCGNCGISCAFGQECVQGNCRCPENTADCDGVPQNGCEMDTGSDASNCGGCGKPCGANEICAAGACTCAAGFDDCDADPSNGCEASLTASDSCGSCATDCGLGGSCTTLATCGCQPGYIDCEPGVPGCETSITDPAHCGSCGTSCSAALPVCDGSKCLADCGALTLCGSSCVDPATDPRNCGGCGKGVGVHQICLGGRPACESGFADCDLNRSDCEVDTRTSRTQCGACGHACKPGAVCSGGTCVCAPATPHDCGGACQQCCTNAHCSDGNSCTTDTCSAGVCGSSAACAAGGHCCAGQGCFECCGNTDCPSGEVCAGNACVVLTCTAPLIPCISRCVNPATDPDNCNGCGSACGPGRTCAAATCTPKWVTMPAPPVTFVAREKAAYAAFASKAFIWGGADAGGQDLATGAVYDTAGNRWSEIAVDANTPSPRVLSTAVWTGTYMVVWGGGDAAQTTDHSDGSRYSPSTNAWSRMSTSGVPEGRRAPYGAWTGSRVFFWGGYNKAGKPLQGGYLYDPSNDTWSAAKGKDQPPGTLDATAGWSGSLFILYGGRPDGSNPTQHTYTYDPSADLWLHRHDGPGARYGALGTWDGSALVVWSGSVLKADGKRYAPSSDSWLSLSGENTPTPRFAPHRTTGWSARMSSGVSLMLGGYGGSTSAPVPLRDGGLYNATTNTWTPVPTWPSASSHLWGVGVLAGTEFVVWGGHADTGSALTTTGERFRP